MIMVQMTLKAPLPADASLVRFRIILHALDGFDVLQWFVDRLVFPRPCLSTTISSCRAGSHGSQMRSEGRGARVEIGYMY